MQQCKTLNLHRFGVTGMPPKEHELHTLVESWPFSSDDPTVQLAGGQVIDLSDLGVKDELYQLIAKTQMPTKMPKKMPKRPV